MSKIVNLNKSFSVMLRPAAPFNFDATVHKPSHFPSSDNLWGKGKYWITMVWKNDVFGVKLEDKGTITKPKIKLSAYSKRPIKKETRNEIIPEIQWRFNLGSDISGFCKKFKNDKYLKEPLKRWRGMRPVAANSFYETLIIYIVLQNATIRRTVQNDAFDIVSPWEQKIYSRLLYNKKLVPTDKILKDIKKRYGHWSKLAIHYIWEDIFWKRKTQRIDWLEKEIRL